MDDFRERKPDIKRLEEGFDIEPVRYVIDQVTQLLMAKTMHEMRKHDKHNPLTLGGVTFYLDFNEITKETRLFFDKDPRTWDQKSILDDANNSTVDIYMEKHAEATIVDNDNPFTY